MKFNTQIFDVFDVDFSSGLFVSIHCRAPVEPNVGDKPKGNEFKDATRQKVISSVSAKKVFEDYDCNRIEEKIQDLFDQVKAGDFRRSTVEKTPLRTR